MGRPAIDLVGRIFGMWTVFRREGNDSLGQVLWLCRCTCGIERSVVGNNLRSGQSKSCGCIRVDKLLEHHSSLTEFKNELEDITGLRINRWTVLERVANRGKTAFWMCQCECGTLKEVNGRNVRRGRSQSCGCLQKEANQSQPRNHGLTRHSVYITWMSMLDRCRNSNSKDFKYYGGRGITVCDRWLSFKNFWEDMSASWRAGLTIERKDVNGDYEPTNCMWIPQAKQPRNRRNNIYLDTPEGKVLLIDVAEHMGIRYDKLLRRYHEGLRGDALFALTKDL